jgi:hypothetical protein
MKMGTTPGAVRHLREMWEYKTGQPLGPGWNAAFADWIKKFGFALVADAVQKASVAGYSEDGERLPPNIREGAARRGIADVYFFVAV